MIVSFILWRQGHIIAIHLGQIIIRRFHNLNEMPLEQYVPGWEQFVGIEDIRSILSHPPEKGGYSPCLSILILCTEIQIKVLYTINTFLRKPSD